MPCSDIWWYVYSEILSCELYVFAYAQHMRFRGYFLMHLLSFLDFLRDWHLSL